MMSVFLIVLEVCILGCTFTSINADTDPSDGEHQPHLLSFLLQLKAPLMSHCSAICNIIFLSIIYLSIKRD